MKIRTIITATVLMCMIAQGTVAVNAQSLSGRAEDMRHKILKTFHKRVYNHEYPLREIPVETSPNAHQTRKSPGRAASFTDRVWFPGEWEEVKAIKAAYPGYSVYCIDVRQFDGTGGAIHCVTKQIPADNPIRILHKNIHGSINLGELTGIPVSAVITNRSGIDHAEVFWRDNGGDWQKLDLTANGNRFYGSLPISLTNVPHAVEYYISATSNNGKTITKPITASQGGYFTFTYNDGNPEFDSTMFDFDTKPMPMERITFTLGTDWLTEDTTEDEPIATGIENVQRSTNDGWFTLDGRKLSGKPNAKGIYIYNGRKRSLAQPFAN